MDIKKLKSMIAEPASKEWFKKYKKTKSKQKALSALKK